MKDMHIKFVEQTEQSYETVGDYGETGDCIWFKITKFKDHPEYSIAILQHEIHEFFRNLQEGISIKDVDDFDRNYDYKHGEFKDDVGCDPKAPYHSTHMEADAIERLSIIFSKADWIAYEKAIKALFPED